MDGTFALKNRVKTPALIFFIFHFIGTRILSKSYYRDKSFVLLGVSVLQWGDGRWDYGFGRFVMGQGFDLCLLNIESTSLRVILACSSLAEE